VNVREAKSLAFGSTKSKSLLEYYTAWQYLLDNHVALSEPDSEYLQKLIDDGIVIDIMDK
jgi:hypothetical protein